MFLTGSRGKNAANASRNGRQVDASQIGAGRGFPLLPNSDSPSFTFPIFYQSAKLDR
jgi:hypothetical protein